MTSIPSSTLSQRDASKIQALYCGWTVTLALALSACAAPSWHSPDAPSLVIPANWSSAALPNRGAASSDTNALAGWWQRFNDPLLSTLVTQALQANTSVRAAQAALQQARALRDVQSATLQPDLNAAGSARRARSAGIEARNTFQLGLDASWEIDVFGRQHSALNASEFDALAAQMTLADVQVSLAAEVALTYIQLRGQQSQLLIARNNLASQSETLQITEWRAQAGLVTALEVEQARAASERTAAQLPTLEANSAKTRHALAVLTGQAPAALETLLAPSQPIPQTAAELALRIPAQTLRQRADVRSAEHRINAALARVSAADAARYPGFSISGNVGLNAVTLAGLGNGAALASALLGSVSVPLLDGGAARAQVRAQEAALEQARINYQAVVLTALKEVEDALVALRGDTDRLAHLQAAASAAANADLLAQQRYRSGLIDFQTVLQTQRTLLSAQDSVASGQTDISADQVRLYKALGGGWN